MTRPAKPPPMNATVTCRRRRLALDPLGVGIVEVAAELPGHLEVLVVAVGPQPLVALLRVPLAKAARVNLSHRRTPSYHALPGIATSDS